MISATLILLYLVGATSAFLPSSPRAKLHEVSSSEDVVLSPQLASPPPVRRAGPREGGSFEAARVPFYGAEDRQHRHPTHVSRGKDTSDLKRKQVDGTSWAENLVIYAAAAVATFLFWGDPATYAILNMAFAFILVTFCWATNLIISLNEEDFSERGATA